MRVAASAVELGDQQRRVVHAAPGQCLGQLRAVVPLAALDLEELCDEVSLAGSQELRHGPALRLEPEPRPPLLLSAHTQVLDDLLGHDGSMTLVRLLVGRNVTRATLGDR